MVKAKKVYFCKQCGAKMYKKTESGLCIECVLKNMKENIKQLREKKGEYYEKWRQGIMLALQGRKKKKKNRK